jgi:hypothetical protein
MTTPEVSLSLKRFLLIEQCPAEWKSLDLYLFRDQEVVFYVGQSHLAFARVWEHLLSGFKGHSIVGRFVWNNWPVSMKFNIELFSSQAEQFNSLGNDLNAAERALIQQYAPCFNISLNQQPTPLPAAYRPPNARLRCGGLNKLIHQAERAVRDEDNRRWVEELE